VSHLLHHFLPQYVRDIAEKRNFIRRACNATNLFHDISESRAKPGYRLLPC